MNFDSVKIDIFKHAEREYPKECCGLVILSGEVMTYKPCTNIVPDHEDKERGPEYGFCISPMDYADAEDEGDIVAVVHSHPDAGAHPSQHDLDECDDGDIDWIIVSWPDAHFYQFSPRKNRPYEGRIFKLGVSDCWSIIMDWYKREFNIQLDNHSVDNEWWKSGGNLYLENFEDEGFKVVEGELKAGDVIIMSIASKVPNHGAVYLGDGKMLHHMYGRKSAIVPYNDHYKERTSLVCRYKDL